MKSQELNKDIRRKIAKSNLRHYEISNYLGVNQFTFAHWLQSEMTKERKAAISRAIDELLFNEEEKRG